MRRASRAALLVGFALWGVACSGPGPDGRAPGAAGEPPTVYTVERGDTLYSIATRYGLDHKRVAGWNDISPPYTIYPGQDIRLKPPVPGGRDGSSSSSSPSDAPAGGNKGDKAPSSPGSKRAASGHDWAWPADGEVVRSYASSAYGKKGISIGGEHDAPVRAADAGRVVYSGNGLRGYGNLIIVKHDETYLTAYGYNKALLVDEGDEVDRQDPIGRLGKTPDGNVAVHFELRRDGEPVNPLHYLPAR